MTDLFTFANTQQGRELRTHVADIYRLAGRPVREFEEDFTDGDMTTHVLRLEVGGKRAGEGQIAADMKRRAR